MRIGKKPLVAVASVALCIAVASWLQSVQADKNVASALVGRSRDDVVRQLGTPNIKVATSQLQNPLFSPPEHCSSLSVATAYIYYRRFGRKSLLVYFDQRDNVTCVGQRGLGLL